MNRIVFMNQLLIMSFSLFYAKLEISQDLIKVNNQFRSVHDNPFHTR